MKKIICVLLAVCLLVLSVGCDSTKTTQSVKETLDEIFTQQELQELSAFASGIKPEYKLEMSAVYYYDVKSWADELSKVGIKGTAFLISELESFTGDEFEYIHKGFYASVIFANWRVSPQNSLGLSWSYVNQPANNPFEKGCFVGFYRCANERIPKIISSDKEISVKFEELREFGILAIPFIVEEIERGNDEYVGYFREIGLHLSTPEFMEHFGNYFLLDEENHMAIINHPKAEGFDYKAWLDENKEDLDNLFKFLDAYCAEYEAEQNK